MYRKDTISGGVILFIQLFLCIVFGDIVVYSYQKFIIDNWLIFLFGLLILSLCFLQKFKKVCFNCVVNECVNTNKQYSLQSVFDNDIDVTQGEEVLLWEQDETIDLFDRQGMVMQLTSAITKSVGDKNFVISLEGPWGCGKTTILNMTKEKLKTVNSEWIVIDDFEPWQFGNQQAILTSMYETIVEALGIKLDIIKQKRYTGALVRMVSDRYGINSIHDIIFTNNEKKVIDEIRLDINNHLKYQNKKVVFFVDNIDRISEEYIILLFRIVSVVFNLPNLVYVLSFERERLEVAFERTLEVDSRYLEKVINMQINVPVISTKSKNKVYGKCIDNLLEHYGVEKDKLDNFKFVRDFIVNEITDIRQFKRWVNSCFGNTFCNSYMLYKPDLLALSTICFLNPKLYEQLSLNKKYLVSYDSDDEFLTEWFKKDFQKELSEKLKFIIDNADNRNYLGLLKYMFATINKWSSDSNTSIKNLEYQYAAMNCRMISGRYFELYFSQTSNDYILARQEIFNLIKEVNKAPTEIEVENIFDEKLKNLKIDYNLFYNTLSLHANDISEEISGWVAKKLIMNSALCEDDTFVNSDKPYRKIATAASNVLLNLDADSFEEFIDKMKHVYIYLWTFECILSDFTHCLKAELNDNKRNVIQDKCNYLSAILKKEYEYILENKISLYVDVNYKRYNIYSLLKYCKDSKEAQHFKQYIRHILDKDSVYRILWDVAMYFKPSSEESELGKKTMKMFFDDEQKIEDCLCLKKVETDQEKYIHQLYDKYKANAK